MLTSNLLRKGQLLQALESANFAIGLAEKIAVEPLNLTLLAYKLRILILIDDIEAAKETIEIGETLLRDVNRLPTMNLGSFLSARFLYDMVIFQKSIVLGEQQDNLKLKKAAFMSGKRALSNSKMNAGYRTEVYRLTGKYYWLVNKQKKALKWWSKSISEGKRLGARPDLARTYLEVGKRFSASEVNIRNLMASMQRSI